MFFSSPSNDVNAHIALLDNLNCSIFLVQQPIPSIAEQILSRRCIQTIELPPLDSWLKDADVIEHRYQKCYTDACHDPFVVLHSSGSTGVPKVLILAHGTLAPVDSFRVVPSLGGQAWQALQWKGKRILTSFPWFHAAGIMFLLSIAVSNEITPVIVPCAAKITAEIADKAILHGNIQACLFSPSVLVALAENPSYLDNLRRLESVSYAGGPLSSAAGDTIPAKTRLQTCFGSTETGYLPTEISDPENWRYLKYSAVLGHEFRYFGDGMYELVIVRNSALDTFQGFFFTFPHLNEYSTNDLFIRHPSKPDWWRHIGRTDNVVGFLDARKLNPALMESRI